MNKINYNKLPQQKRTVVPGRMQISYQLLNPRKKLIKSLIKAERGEYRYSPSYALEAKKDGIYQSATVMVEWMHGLDKYIVQAMNVPSPLDNRGQTYSKAWANYKGLGHPIDGNSSMLLMFELRKDNINFNVKVSHVPTRITFFDWSSGKLPRFTFIRENHQNELQLFLSERLQIDGQHGGSSYEGELLPRFERHPKKRKGNAIV